MHVLAGPQNFYAKKKLVQQLASGLSRPKSIQINLVIDGTYILASLHVTHEGSHTPSL